MLNRRWPTLTDANLAHVVDVRRASLFNLGCDFARDHSTHDPGDSDSGAFSLNTAMPTTAAPTQVEQDRALFWIRKGVPRPTTLNDCARRPLGTKGQPARRCRAAKKTSTNPWRVGLRRFQTHARTCGNNAQTRVRSIEFYGLMNRVPVKSTTLNVQFHNPSTASVALFSGSFN
jgi:hypothetical protein